MGSISCVPLIKSFEYFVFSPNYDWIFILLSVFIYLGVALSNERIILPPFIPNLEYIANRPKTIF